LRHPKLAVILLGDDAASQLYVRNKILACQKIGILSVVHQLPNTIEQSVLSTLIQTLNSDENIDGILIQLPLPHCIDTQATIELIDPQKDVDGLHPYNMGRLLTRRPLLKPCTPQGIIAMLDHYQLNIAQKKAVIVGQSNIVGRPMALELLAKQATVIVCHSKTQHLSEEIANADILVACLGKPRYILGNWIKKGAIVIDVGIHRLANQTLCGDVDFEGARHRAAWISPVPKGVGPMTIAMLLKNTVYAMKMRLHLNELT
jgi:methylenetetrahydrofolate dehydrogenase (NADP+)/methenyltetrahydrofolate cyclohydrolase